MKCQLCGGKFEQAHPWDHVCPECEDAVEGAGLCVFYPAQPDPIARELADPALMARIEEGVRKRLEEP